MIPRDVSGTATGLVSPYLQKAHCDGMRSMRRSMRLAAADRDKQDGWIYDGGRHSQTQFTVLFTPIVRNNRVLRSYMLQPYLTMTYHALVLVP